MAHNALIILLYQYNLLHVSAVLRHLHGEFYSAKEFLLVETN